MPKPLLSLCLLSFLLGACNGHASAELSSDSGADSPAAPGAFDANAPPVDAAPRSDGGSDLPDAGDPPDHDAAVGGSAKDAAVGSSDAAAAVIALGYYTGDQTSYNAVVSFSPYLTMISSDNFAITADGGVTGGDGLGGNTYASAHGIAPYACLSNYSDSIGDFDPALGHSAMVTYKTAVIAGAVSLAKSGYAGVNIDFESLAYSANVADDRAAYSSFIHDLGAALHAAGLKLVISVPGKTGDSASDTWSYPYDFATLGGYVDYMQVMTYDENGPGWSAPGPVSGADWVSACVTYAASIVPPGKLLLGLPAYGYEWDLTASNADAGTYVGDSVSWTGFGAIVATKGAVMHWDTPSSSPYVDYTTSDGHSHEMWYENAESITAKTKLVLSSGIAGYSMWSLGQEDLSFWQAAAAGAP